MSIEKTQLVLDFHTEHECTHCGEDMLVRDVKTNEVYCLGCGHVEVSE